MNGNYGDIEFVDNVATFTLKHGESKSAAGLPEGTAYTVEESGSEGYTQVNQIKSDLSDSGKSRAMQGSGIPAGVYVTEAVSGSPAYDAGIQPGDIIVKFGTKEIGSFKDLQAQIENSASGVSVSVNVMRKGRDGYTEIPFLVSLRAR